MAHYTIFSILPTGSSLRASKTAKVARLFYPVMAEEIQKLECKANFTGTFLRPMVNSDTTRLSGLNHCCACEVVQDCRAPSRSTRSEHRRPRFHYTLTHVRSLGSRSRSDVILS